MMSVSLIMFFWLMLLVFLLFILNSGMMILSSKIFMNNFFGDLELIFNIWSILFLLMVIFISSSVMIFSFSYMSSLMVTNFLLLYTSFVFSMLWLVLSSNFYWLMLGWDGLGVVSFLLIIFYLNYESVNNGLFTLFQNRLGDVFFVSFILGTMTLEIQSNLILKFGLLILILGACVKSAQFPFNTWLLAAMSAPTPISSLVHSSTLVVAGVYILLQFNYCLFESLNILKYIAVLSLIISSFGLLNETDMKKLIAYSTMNHVSLMMFMLSLKLFKVVYFHLNIHAMFKSLMFMCFGFVMLASFHGQDKRLISMMFLNPMIKIIYYFSCLCLAGLPFLSGFFSKDFMIEKMMEWNVEFIWVILLIFFLSMSIYYSLKLMNLEFKQYNYELFEKNFLGMLSVMFMLIVMILFINVFLSMMLSLSLEIFSMKIFIYFFILIFAMGSIFTNLNYKMTLFSKMMNFKEIWSINLYELDKFMYWNMFMVLSSFSLLNFYKIFLLMNWWVVSILIFLF